MKHIGRDFGIISIPFQWHPHSKILDVVRWGSKFFQCFAVLGKIQNSLAVPPPESWRPLLVEIGSATAFYNLLLHRSWSFFIQNSLLKTLQLILTFRCLVRFTKGSINLLKINFRNTCILYQSEVIAISIRCQFSCNTVSILLYSQIVYTLFLKKISEAAGESNFPIK